MILNEKVCISKIRICIYWVIYVYICIYWVIYVYICIYWVILTQYIIIMANEVIGNFDFFYGPFCVFQMFYNGTP